MPVLEATIRSLDPKAVWVDALIIPQNDPERGTALRSMGAFYALSEHTVAVLPRAAAAALADIRNTGRIDEVNLRTLARDPCVTRAWTYQELVNSGTMSFIAEGDMEPPVPAQTFLNALGHTLAQMKQSDDVDSFGFRSAEEPLDRLEDALGDWISSDLGSRFAAQSMAGMSRREAGEPADLFAAQFGALRSGLILDPPDATVYPAEDLMRLSEDRDAYAFIYSAANRNPTPVKRWRPIGEPPK